ncbi:MAG: asparagine synthase-related protein [Mucilaginibacter sp.]
MSVIFGRVNFEQILVTDADACIMSKTLDHWQADDRGVWLHNNIALGHLMLYNTPSSLHEKQPYYHNEAGLTITADARLDNREELFKKLQLPRQHELTLPDSTLILKTYQQYGESCVKHLVGDFAFAIWDEREQKMFCARDHMGVKPFFYCMDNNFFAFASETKGLLCLPDVNKSIDEQYVYNHLIPRFDQNLEDTLYKKIKRLAPAHSLTIYASSKRSKLNSYWQLDTSIETIQQNKENYYEGLAWHFDEAVRCRTITSYPIGAELSGGLDSSAICGAAQYFLQQNNQNLTTFSNVLPTGITDEWLFKSDESPYIKDVLAHNNISDAVYLTDRMFNNTLEEASFALKINDGIDSVAPAWQLPSRKAAFDRNIRTLLSGFPGDQMVTSQNKHYFLDYLFQGRYVKYFLAKQKHTPHFNKIRALLPQDIASVLLKIKDSLGYYDKNIKTALSLYNIPDKNLQAILKKQRYNAGYRQVQAGYREGQRSIIMKPFVPNRMETESRYGLHFRLEMRFPMADIRLLQYYSAMPNFVKYEGPIGRYAYRLAVKKYLPQSIFNRDDKSGSIAPFMSIPAKDKYESIRLLLNSLPDTVNLIKKDEILRRLKREEDNPEYHPITFYELMNARLPTIEFLQWLQTNPVW